MIFAGIFTQVIRHCLKHQNITNCTILLYISICILQFVLPHQNIHIVSLHILMGRRNFYNVLYKGFEECLCRAGKVRKCQCSCGKAEQCIFPEADGMLKNSLELLRKNPSFGGQASHQQFRLTFIIVYHTLL